MTKLLKGYVLEHSNLAGRIPDSGVGDAADRFVRSGFRVGRALGFSYAVVYGLVAFQAARTECAFLIFLAMG
jgi:hypothetical protein